VEFRVEARRRRVGEDGVVVAGRVARGGIVGR